MAHDAEKYAAPLRPIPLDKIGTDDVLRVLKPLWTSRPETASRLRGRIERVLEAATVRGYRSGPNPALWRGSLSALLPKPKKLIRGHHPAMPFHQLPNFIATLRERDTIVSLDAGVHDPHGGAVRGGFRRSLGRDRPERSIVDDPGRAHEGAP